MNNFGKLDLRSGPGGDYKNGLCLMEAVAWMANEGATDAPECACPVLGRFAIRLNDNLNDENRQQLRKLILPMTGTRSKEHEKLRSEYLVLNVARKIVSLAFDKANLSEHAEAFRSVKDIDELRDVAKKARSAADAGITYADAAAAAAAYAAYTADAADALAVAVTAYAALADAASAADGGNAYAAARQETYLKSIPILEEAIKLGPNAADQWPKYLPRAEALAVFVEKELA